MKRFLLVSSLLVAGTGYALAGGYKIPEQSLRSTGTSGAYFSSASSADTAYYNPANMSFMKDGWGLEVGFRYIVLPYLKFGGRVYDPVSRNFVDLSASSNREDFVVPYFHYVSPRIGNFRLGLSVTTPAGLAKSWEDNFARTYAKRFQLEVYETSLSASYLISDAFSVGGGVRAVYSRGEVEFAHPSGAYSVSMDGSTDIEPAYFLSLSLRPVKGLTLSALYRSGADLKIEGDASGYFFTPERSLYSFDTQGNVEVPLPAELRVGASYKFENTVFEFTYERTFWSAYEKLDFNYQDAVVENSFGTPQPKDWKDTNTYRFGIMHSFSNKLTGMLGIAYDETPIPERTVGFELPDSDGWIFSLGGIYKPKPQVEIGIAYLLFIKEDRNVNNERVRGEFSDISAHMLTLSLGYGF